jgi:very-short-patch-repair endonuclease
MLEVKPDRIIEWVARRQHGVFSRAQALAAGCTPRVIMRRRESGAWLTLDRGVYALNGAPLSWHRRAKAAELSVPGAAVSHRAAAYLSGLCDRPPGGLDITVAAGNRSATRLATLHQVEPLFTTMRQRVTVTPLPLTLLQLAAVEPPPRLERLVDDALVAGLVTLAALGDELELRASGHPNGIGALRDLLDERGEGYVPPSNLLEAALYDVLDDPLIPAFQRQAAFPWRGGSTGIVDALIPAWRRIIEADGRRWHTRRADFERDRGRDHAAQQHGYEVTRFTYGQLVSSPGYARSVLLDIGRRVIPTTIAS